MVFIYFCKKIKTKNGFVLSDVLQPAEPNSNDIANPVHISKSGGTSFKTAHAALYHSNDVNTRYTSKKLGITTSGTSKNCPHCAVAKDKQQVILLKNPSSPYIPIEDTAK